ncbi:MAG: GntR family transcriptional regulator [Kangiellaceae bacterium]|nr:GntR family transcriptional regulator [Kangiellaceae bacterium]
MSFKIGQDNQLVVARLHEAGVMLGDTMESEQLVLLPNRYVPENTVVGDSIDVFVYLDSDDRPIATTEQPLAKVGEVQKLKCLDVNFIGAFMDWGLPKDLLVPFSEQYHEMQVGREYLVYLYIDKASKRIAGSSRLDRFLDKTPAHYTKNQQVELTIRRKTDLGYNAIINHAHTGLIFQSDIISPLQVGQKLVGYIKQVRNDGKIDLSLQKPISQAKVELSDVILQKLKDNDGFLALNDKSKPELIYKLFNSSKATFKKALGKLYKERKIKIESKGIYLTDKQS